MAFDLDNEELRATRRLHGINDGLYEGTIDKNVANDSVIVHKFAIMQQQINEKDKRIQELEEQLKGRTDNTNKPIEVTNLYLNSIPKQVVRDKIKELKNDIKNGNTRYPYIEEHKIEILQELLEGEEVKDVK